MKNNSIRGEIYEISIVLCAGHTHLYFFLTGNQSEPANCILVLIVDEKLRMIRVDFYMLAIFLVSVCHIGPL